MKKEELYSKLRCWFNINTVVPTLLLNRKFVIAH